MAAKKKAPKKSSKTCPVCETAKRAAPKKRAAKGKE
jgi:hypothetical protein